MAKDAREVPVTVPLVTSQARLTSLLFRTGLRFDSSWDSTVWKTWGTSDDGIFYLFITDYIFKIENIYLCVEQKRFGGHGVHWSSILMFPLGVGIPRFAHKPCGRQLSACGQSSLCSLHGLLKKASHFRFVWWITQWCLAFVHNLGGNR